MAISAVTEAATTETLAPEAASRPVRRLELGALKDIAAGLARSATGFADRVPVDPVQRTGLRLIGTDLYDVWLLRWPPDTNVSPHDHGDSAGAFSVVEGELSEIRWHGGLPEIRSVTPGTVVTIDRGVVHDVVGRVTSLSVHVYSPPLTSMGFYGGPDNEGIGVVPVEDGSLLFAASSPANKP